MALGARLFPAGGNSQLNGLFYALFMMEMVDRVSQGVVDGCMKYMTKPLNILIKILIPAEIGKFMIQEQPKLVGKAIVGPVTHGVVHGVTQAVAHGLTRSVTSAVTVIPSTSSCSGRGEPPAPAWTRRSSG